MRTNRVTLYQNYGVLFTVLITLLKINPLTHVSSMNSPKPTSLNGLYSPNKNSGM